MRHATSSTEARSSALATCELFGTLGEPDLRALAQVTTLQTYEAGETVFRQDAEADGFYVVVEGGVNIHRLGIDGREQVLHVFGPGEVCGEVPVFQGTTYPAFAAAALPSRLLFVPSTAFRSISVKNPGILHPPKDFRQEFGPVHVGKF